MNTDVNNIGDKLLQAFPAGMEQVPNEFVPTKIHQREWLIHGELKEWKGPISQVLSPIHFKNQNGDLLPHELGTLPDTGIAEADLALSSAEDAYDHGRGLWPTMSTYDRISCMQKFTKLMLAKREVVVNLLMWEIGKSRADSEKEFDRTIEYIQSTIAELKQMDNGNSRFQVVDGTVAQIRRSPLGVVLCMGPYNYPLNETFCTLIPALLMGNVVIFKPPRFGVLLYQPLLEAFQSAFPAGVINILYGRGSVVVPHIIGSGKVNVLALIGSSKVADQLKKCHPKSNRLRAILGLDAKNSAIILPDANIDSAIKECLTGALSFNGQRCTALKMILVHSSIAGSFVTKFAKAVNELKAGMPWEKMVAITPLPNMEKVGQMNEYVEDALKHGAKVINTGGGVHQGTLYYPAVIYPAKPGMRVYREEQFGPVVPIATYTDIDEAMDYIISSDHGQQVSIFGEDADQVSRLIDSLVNQVCRVNINSQCQRGPDVFPFTGRKDSAEGTLSVHDALRAFSIRTMVATKKNEGNERLFNQIVKGQKSNFLNTNFIL